MTSRQLIVGQGAKAVMPRSNHAGRLAAVSLLAQDHMLPDTLIDRVWLAIGLLGQLLFAGRFIWQWWASEKRGRSVVPVAFWYLSLSGGLILTAYAIYRQDVVFALGQASGLAVYGRNLQLIRRRLATRRVKPAG